MKGEDKVFTDKLAALKYSRQNEGMFFEANVPSTEAGEPAMPIYIVALSEYRARLVLVDYLMPITKWAKKRQDDEYIAALEAEAEILTAVRHGGADGQEETEESEGS